MVENQLPRPIPLETFSFESAVVAESSSTAAIATGAIAHRHKHSSINTQTDEVLSSELMYGKEKDPANFPDGGVLAYLVLFGSFCGLFTSFGVANSAGPIESYIKSHQLAGVDQTLISWVFSLHMAILYFGGVIFGPMFDRFGARLPLFIGLVLTTGGLLLLAQLTKLVHFIMSYGVCTALGCLIMMLPTVGAISHWFLRKRAMASSVATMGGLVAGAVFCATLPKLYETIGYAWAIRTIALICCGSLILSVIFCKERVLLTPSENQPSQSKLKLFLNFVRNLLDLSLLTNKQFLFLAAASGLAEIVCMLTLTYLSSYAINHGVSFSAASLLITIVTVSGIPARIVSGWMADRWGRFNMMLANAILSTLVIFALWFPAKGSVAFLYVFGVFFGIFSSAVVLLIPACAGQICSADNFGKVYGTLYFVLAFVIMVGMYLASVVISYGSEIDYGHLVLYEGGISAGSAVAWLLARWLVVGWNWCKF